MFDGPIFSNPIYTFGFTNSPDGSIFSPTGLATTDYKALAIKLASFNVIGISDGTFHNLVPDLTLTINATNSITARLTYACLGLKCTGYRGCVHWKYRNAKNSNTAAWIPAITVCDLRIYN